MSAPGEFPYIHGFSEVEQARLRKQARLAEALVFRDVDFSDCRHILEVGCGVGAQTEILLRRFPELRVTGVDLSEKQLSAAVQHLESLPWCRGRYELHRADAADLPFEARRFDGAFLCWILEHVPRPSSVLAECRRVLAPGAPIYVTEVLNSSFFLDPYSPNLVQYWTAFNDHQYESGGDPFIGAKLGNLLLATGFQQVITRIKSFHLDNREPAKRKAMIAFWEELLLSAADQLLKRGKVTEAVVEGMKRELKQVQNDPNAVFFFAFVQAEARVY